MAYRAATKYKLMELDLTRKQFKEFIQMLKTKHVQTEVRIFDNGDTEIVLHDEGMEIPLSFRNMGAFLKYEGSYTIRNWKLAHIMQKAVRTFKGHALVQRIYDRYIIEYLYEHGTVVQIKELRGSKQRMIYKYKNEPSKLQRLFNDRYVEDQIEWVRLQIDILLDVRIKYMQDPTKLKQIDQTLQKLSQELFFLEA